MAKRSRTAKKSEPIVRAHLSIRSWVGTSALGASHYYGELHIPGPKDFVQVGRPLTAREAKQFNKEAREHGDTGFTYRVGDLSGRFWDEKSVKDTAIEYIKANHPEIVLLLEGNRAVCDPQPVLFGPEPLKTELNKLVAEAEANDWWEGNDDKMENISQRWKILTKDNWK